MAVLAVVQAIAQVVQAASAVVAASNTKKGFPNRKAFLSFNGYTPMHDVAPRAVNTAVAIDAIICTKNFKVSFFVITFNV